MTTFLSVSIYFMFEIFQGIVNNIINNWQIIGSERKKGGEDENYSCSYFIDRSFRVKIKYICGIQNYKNIKPYKYEFILNLVSRQQSSV